MPVYANLAAVGVMLAGGLGVLGNGIVFCIGFNAEFITGRGAAGTTGIIMVFLLGLAVLASLIAIAGAIATLMARCYWLAIAGCVAVALATHIVVVGLVVGILAQIALLQADVKEAFR
jgi:hypothetical protein